MCLNNNKFTKKCDKFVAMATQLQLCLKFLGKKLRN